MKTELFEFEEEMRDYTSEECPRCGGEGKVTTRDYESYFGANFKPCPVCAGNPCIGEPPKS